MAKRRDRALPQSHSSIGVNIAYDPGSSSVTPPSASSTFLSFPRAASPSSITGFFSKPSKWFSRPSSNTRHPPSPGIQDPPRLSTSSGTRRPTISGPTDPRPIIPAAKSEGHLGSSRSVLDLTLPRTQNHGDGGNAGQEEYGDLRSMARKGWSRSADDLGRFSNTQIQPINVSNLEPGDSSQGEGSVPSPTKARIEAYRRNTPHLPQSNHTYYPFPTIQTTSSSPPSPPVTPPHVTPAATPASAHNRSFSHTPFQSSKLASPSSPVFTTVLEQALPMQALPSQSRNRTISSERDKDKANRSGFTFPFSSNGASNRQVNPSPSVSPVSMPGLQLPPPLQPSLPPLTESKRTSQIVHYSGFINLHAHGQSSFRSGHTLSATLTKGWKPYKVVLKGSKLYFYKPPSDRTIAIKELFPQGMDVVPEELPETVQEESDTLAKIYTKDREDGRRRMRLYRGRATHPELNIAEDGFVVKGSGDALIHEAVFGTSFTRGDPTQAEDKWKTFASSVVFCLPRLIGRAKFESEFIRYASYLIGDADEERSQLQLRTLWLAERYTMYQGGPANGQAWNTFRTEFFPSGSITESTHVIETQVDSPNLNTFSPRPSQSQMLSSFASFSAVATPPRPSLSRPSMSPLRSERNLWSAIEKEGLKSDMFFKLDSITLARSLLAFHRSLLAKHRRQFCAADLVGRESHIVEEASSLDDLPFTTFFGSDDNPHWLTRFIVVQVLNADGLAITLSGSQSDAAQISKTHLRSDLINKWVRIGEQCRVIGDRCSWKAIEAALSSRPIARLDKVWKRVDGSALRSFQSWLKADAHLQPSDQRSTPWGGDVRERVAEILHQARIESSGKDEQWDAIAIQNAFKCIEPLILDFSRFSTDAVVDEQNDDIFQLSQLWQSVHSQAPGRLLSLNSYLSQSLAAEPRQRGRFEPYHWQRPPNASSFHTLVPLLFVEPLPTLTLIDRDHIYRGKKESLDGASGFPGLDEAQVSRMTRMKSSPEIRVQSRDMRGRESSKLLTGNDMNGTVLRMYNGELLLVPESLFESRPRQPGSLEPGLDRRASHIRATNSNLERKTSMARRSSLPSLSQRSSLVITESAPETTLRVIVKAGTLDRLVDILISGFEGVSVAVTDDNGEMPLRDEHVRTLKLDRDEFRTTWWSVFRSFVTPLVLFEFLRKRFLTRSVATGASCKLCLDIFSTLTEWIDKGGGAQDALGDPELFDALHNFLTTSAVTDIPDGTSDQERIKLTELETARLGLVALYRSQTRRPKLHTSQAYEFVPATPSDNFGPEPPVFDEIEPETLVNNLDALAASAMRSVTQEDLLVTIDLLEIQSADRTGWFLSHEPSTSTDEVEVQTIYSYLQQIEPSILISELAQESLYKILPPTIRNIVRAHAIIRKWIMAKIVAPRLGLRVRQMRMECLLRAIEVCRLRMAELAKHNDVSPQRPVRSFVETAIISAITSPESRLFSSAWLGVATARGTGTESVATLLRKPAVQTAVCKNWLTFDIGWLMERFLEVISVPNTIDSDGEVFNLVNFEKRRHLSDLVSTTLSLLPQRPGKDHVDIDRLNNMHREVTGPPFDIRPLKDDAYHESMTASLPIPHSKKNQRPFLKMIQVQQEKLKRDKYIRERLLREKKFDQQRTDKREDDINRAMQLRQPNSQSIKHQRSRRTMSSAFFHLMRPLSSAFSSTDNLFVPVEKRTAAELDFQPTGKPTLVISLVGALVSAFVNNVRLYMFHLTTEDGGRYLLQAATRTALTSWLTAISQTAKSSTAKRLTYIANSPKPQYSDHIHYPPQTATRHPTAAFGVDLDFLLRRECGGEVPLGAVPRVLEQCLAEIEARGLQEVGLYRIPGATSAIATLRNEFDSGEEVKFFSQEYVDIFAVCDIVKTWLRSLPQPIFPPKSYHEVIRIMQIPDFEERLTAVRDVVHGLPANNFYLLRRICEHLERITDYEEQNQMTAQALAVLFNPTLLRAPLNDFGMLMHNMNHTSQLLQTLIIHFHRVFDEIEIDVDQDDETEADADVKVAEVDRRDSRSSSVPTDAIHDHDPDLEPLPSLQPSYPETF